MNRKGPSDLVIGANGCTPRAPACATAAPADTRCETTRIYYPFSQDRDGLVPGPSAAEIAAGDVLGADGTWKSGGAGGADSVARSMAASAALTESSDFSAATSSAISQSTLISTADSKAVSAASGGGADSVARSSIASAVLLESSDISIAASRDVSQSTLISAAGSKATSAALAESSDISVATSQNTSQSVLISSLTALESTDISAAASRDTSQSTLISTATTNASAADSKAVSDSVVISSNLSLDVSKATSQSTLISIATTNASAADSKAVSAALAESSDISVLASKDVSQSTLISIAASKGDSAAGGSNDSTARSMATSAALVESTDTSAALSRNVSQSTLISTATTNASAADSKAVSDSVIISTNLSTSTSQNTSQSTLISTATTNASAADSKAVSDSTVISTNLSTATSQNTSQSALISTATTNASVADSKAVSDSVVISSNLSTETSHNTSQSLNVSTADSKAVSVSLAPFVGGTSFRNRLVNGDPSIDQQNAGASATVNTTGALVYSADKWIAIGTSAAGVITIQQLSTTPPPGFLSYLHLAVTTADAAPAAGSSYSLRQNVEGTYIPDFQLGIAANTRNITLSFWARSSLTGTFSGALVNNANNRSYVFTYTISVAATWTYVSITISSDVTGTWLTTTGIGLRVIWDLGTGSTFTNATTGWQAALILRSTGSVGLVATLSATLDLTGVQLEPGSIAHEFERLPYEVALQLCQREFQKSFLLSTVPAQNAGIGTGEFLGVAGRAGVLQQLIFINFPVLMRGAPSITTYNPGAVNAFARDETASADCSSNGTFSITERGATLTAIGNASTVPGNLIGVHATLDARL